MGARAKEIPKMIFDFMVKDLEVKTSKVTSKGECYEFFFNRIAGAAVCCMESKCRLGWFSCLSIWQMPLNCKKHDFFNTTFLNKPPYIQIIGGPFPNGMWNRTQGSKLVETVKIIYSNKVSTEFDHPFFLFVHAVADLFIQEAVKEKPPKIQYWEAYINSQKDYTRPL